MKVFLLLLCHFIVFGISYSYAQTVYVTDEFEITMRTGPSIENKIIAMLSTGTELQVIEESDDWILVKDLTGKEEWIFKRYASDEIPKKIILEQLRNKYQEALKNLKVETERASTFDRENKELRSALNASNKNLEKVKKDYNTLTVESKDFLDLKKEHTLNLTNLGEATAELTKLKKENEDLRLSTNVIWFLSGAVVVVVSWVVGFIMGKVRRRSRSLYG